MSTRGRRENPKVTANQRAYLAALDNWLARGANDEEGLDRELVDVTLDDMLDEVDPSIRARIEDRQQHQRVRRGRGRTCD